MMNRKTFKYLPGFALAGSVIALAMGSGGCSAASTLVDAAQGCNEFPSSVASLSIGGSTQAFVTASADVVNVAASMEASLLTACGNIAKDLGKTDTWTAKASTDDKVNEACAQASAAITATLSGDAGASGQCGLSITGGQCTASASVEADCEAKCSGMASCTPPDVTVSCDPGQLSGTCSAMCTVGATCEGSATVAADCQGTCEADCSGSCTPPMGGSITCNGTCMGNCNGTCTASGGTGMPSTGTCAGTCSGKCDAACMITPATPGHCEGTCSGKCTGSCKITAMGGISCSGMATCKGGCSVAVTAPKCEGTITPAKCSSDVNCQGSCSGHANLTAMCTPPAVTLQCSGTASASITALVTTVQTNMPAIIEALQVQGPLAVQAAGKLVTTGQAVVSGVASASGKAIACAGVAAKASVTAAASVNVSVMASASVSGSCGGPSS